MTAQYSPPARLEAGDEIIDSSQVALLVCLSRQTLYNYIAQPHLRHLVPPGWFRRPGSRRLLWVKAEVLAWLSSGRTPNPSPRPTGRPKGSTARAMAARRDEAQAAADAAGGGA